MKRQEAPHPLELVRQFVNTRDLEQGTDRLASVGSAREWLVEHGLITASDPLDERDRQRVAEVREALRALARANTASRAGQDPAEADDASRRTLDAAVRDAGVRLRFLPDGTPELAPDTTAGVTGALGRCLAVAGHAAFDGTWRRLKICPSEDCQWAFYDHSRNRSGTWCQMAECGNRAKVSAYRARRGAG